MLNVVLIFFLTLNFVGVSLLKTSSSNSDVKNGNNLSNGTIHTSDLPDLPDLPLLAVDSNEIIYISSSIEDCSMSQKSLNSGSLKADPISGFNNHLLKTKPKSSTSRSGSGISSGSLLKFGKKSETSQRSKSTTFDFEDSEDPFGSEDPFAFDEDEEKPSKWDVLSGKKNVSQSQKTSSAVEEEEEFGSKDLMVVSQQESSNVERYDSPQASCSHVEDDEKFNLLADCLLSSVKVRIQFLFFSFR